MQIQNLGELNVSYKYKSPLKDRPKITCSKSAYDIFIKLIKEDTIGLQEQFMVLYLNQANKVIGSYNGFAGGVNATLVDVKIIVGTGINLLASAVIIAHNHPSGNLTPSEADIKLTKQIKEGLMLMDIKLLDHLIITPENSYLSFMDDGLL